MHKVIPPGETETTDTRGKKDEGGRGKKEKEEFVLEGSYENERWAREESRLNQVKASPEDRRRTRPSSSALSSSPSGPYRCAPARSYIARKDANTLRMDSSATVKVRLRKGAAALRSYTPAPRTVFRKRILCCGRKINNECSPSFERRMGSTVPSSLLHVLFLPHTAAAWLSSLCRRLARIFCLLDK